MSLNGEKLARQLKQERAELTKANILKVARRHFAAKGFDASNTREIAKDAGSSHAMIRYHFGNKESLWKESIRDMFSALREHTGYKDGKHPSIETKEELREYVRKYITYCSINPEHSCILLAESIRGGERLEWLVEEFIRGSHQPYMPALKLHIKDGNLPNAWPVSMFFMITTMSQIPFVLTSQIKLLYGVDMQTSAALDAHIDSVMSLLFNEQPKSKKAWPSFLL